MSSPTVNRVCTVIGCSARFYAKGWCHRHYYRARRNGGDPVAFKVAQKYDKFDGRGHRWCSRCKSYVDPQLFEEAHPRWCRPCKRLARYGLSRPEYEALPGSDGTCALCNTRPSAHIDHDHGCCPGREVCGKCVRGVLCRECNTALGLIGEGLLMRAVEYVHGGKRI